MRVLRWIGLALAAIWGAVRRGDRRRAEGSEERIVPPGSPERSAESALIVLLLAAIACSVAFVVLYASDGLHNRTQWLGLSLGAALAFLAAALILIGHKLVVTEEIEHDYPSEHPEDREAVARIVRESGSRFTRKRLLATLGGLAGGALGFALITPAVSLGPVLDTESLFDSPWRRGRRLIDEDGRPLMADEIEQKTFYTAYPEGADRKQLGAPVVVVRLDPADLDLPEDRRAWAPEGILAFSKICTHAGCAIALYRAPLFAPTAPKPALVCPCHYSTFDPATGGDVTFGPAGRALPQLPLEVGPGGELRAAGNFSGPVGPSFAGVRRA